PADPIARAEPQRAVLAFSQTLDSVPRPLRGIELWSAGLPSPQPVSQSHPEIAIVIFKETAHSIIKRAVLPIAVDAAIMNGAELPGGWRRQPTGPDSAFVILEHGGTNVLARKLLVLGELSVLPTHKPFRGANPKSAVVRSEQAENAAGRETLTR